MIKIPDNNSLVYQTFISNEINISELINTINSKADMYGVGVSVEEDRIKTGGLFSAAEPCVVIYNKEHSRSYYVFIILQRRQGNFVKLYEYMIGTSKNARNQAVSEQYGNLGIGGKLMGSLIKPNRKKQEDEESYYEMLQSIISSSIGELTTVIS